MMQGSCHKMSHIITNLNRRNKWWETSGGKPGTLTNLRHASVPYYEMKKLNTRAKGQRAARDIWFGTRKSQPNYMQGMVLCINIIVNLSPGYGLAHENHSQSVPSVWFGIQNCSQSIPRIWFGIQNRSQSVPGVWFSQWDMVGLLHQVVLFLVEKSREQWQVCLIDSNPT